MVRAPVAHVVLTRPTPEILLSHMGPRATQFDSAHHAPRAKVGPTFIRPIGTISAMRSPINPRLEFGMHTIAERGLRLTAALLALGVVACGSVTNGDGTDGGGSGGSDADGSDTDGTGADGSDTDGSDADGCPESQPGARDYCEDPGLTCAYETGYSNDPGACDAVVESRCEENAWISETIASCGLVAAKCDPVGKWLVERTGPWQEEPGNPLVSAQLLDAAFLPLELEVTKNADGQLIADTDWGRISDDGCTVDVRWTLWDDVYEEFDEEFYDFASQYIEFVVVGDTGTGEALLTSEGESGGARVAAPILATRQ